MSLSTKWQQTVAGFNSDDPTTYKVTTPDGTSETEDDPEILVTPLATSQGIYAGCFGEVFLMDTSGNLLQQTNLQFFEQEVRLCMAPDASVLIVGVSGYVLGLDPTSLDTIWKTSLPDTGFDMTDVTCYQSLAYAASNGCVFSLNISDGSIQNTNRLPGRGYSPTQIAISQSAQFLFVGINGYVMALNISDLSTAWQQEMPGSQSGITSVVGGWLPNGTEVVFGGCWGWVGSFNATSGTVLYSGNLSQGDGEVRMVSNLVLPTITRAIYADESSGKALNTDMSTILVGCNGYGYSLKAADLTDAWPNAYFDLVGTGFNVTSVAVASTKEVYFGSNGWVFGVHNDSTDGGEQSASNGLPSRGDHEVRLSIDTASNILVMGIYGYIVCCDITPPSSTPSSPSNPTA